jgi:hypothetical protein
MAFAPTRIKILVLLLRQEYRAKEKSRDSQPVLLEYDVMRLRGSLFTESKPRNGLRNPAVPLLVRVLLRNG